MLRKLLKLFATFIQWYLPFLIGTLALEVFHIKFVVENYGKLKIGLTAYFILIFFAFGWRLYDGLYRTGDLLFDDGDCD